MSKKVKDTSEITSDDPHKSKGLLYFSFALTAIGATMILIPTILIFVPGLVDLSWDTVLKLPITWIGLSGLVIVTIGLILHRRITEPMRYAETKKLKSRLE